MTTENPCAGCDQLTSGNACRSGALYGMDRCKRTPAENSLMVEVEGDELVIRVGVNRLDGHDRHPSLPALTFIDREQWVKDVIYELLCEAEDGATPLSDLLDKAMNAALEQGSIGVSEQSATHVGTCELCGKEFATLRHDNDGKQKCAAGCSDDDS